MKKTKNIKSLIVLIIFCSFLPKISFCQSYKDYIDPVWDNYYNRNPSGIETNFKGSDFIKIVEYVNFIPTRSEIRGSQEKLKRVLLILGFESLQQMMITGNFYSRSYKHDDYYYLYNSYYSKIEKITWDRYSPYLIPLMEVDGLIKINN
jgi:hypothetical protein